MSPTFALRGFGGASIWSYDAGWSHNCRTSHSPSPAVATNCLIQGIAASNALGLGGFVETQETRHVNLLGLIQRSA